MASVRAFQPSQSSSARPSSIEAIAFHLLLHSQASDWCQYAVATSEQLVLGHVKASYTAQMAGGRLVGLQTHVDCELP